MITNETNFVKALQAADKGEAWAQNYLGCCYEKGLGTSVNMAAALRCFQKAADDGDAAAQNNLAILYRLGRGVAKDPARAFKLCLSSALQGHPRAENALGAMLNDGIGTQVDQKMAVVWFKQAASHGDLDALCNLGKNYLSGSGVPLDRGEAYSYFKKAAERDHVLSQINLGILYRNDQDYFNALLWFERAAEQSSLDALCYLGKMFEKGEGMPLPNRGEALSHYKAAALKDHPEACFRLGILFPDEDDEDRLFWLNKAFRLGYTRALEFIYPWDTNDVDYDSLEEGEGPEQEIPDGWEVD